MSDLRIDLSEMKGWADSRRRRGRGGRGEGRGDEGRARGAALALLRYMGFAVAVVVFPFFVLIRGGVFAYREWGLGSWPSLLLAALATAVVLGGYAWIVSHHLGAAGNLRRLLVRGAAGVGIAYVLYALVFVASANVKSDDVRAEYGSMHPLLRIASSALILADPAAVITDAGRTIDDYRLMGLPPNEASLHFEQGDGYVHALDLRTAGRSEVRNRTVELLFWALGFHSLRHVGTADHLHVSLRLPEG